MQLEDEHDGEGEPALKAAPVQIAEQAHDVEGGGGQAVVGNEELGAAQDEVAGGQAVGPGLDGRAEAVVGEAAGRVEERVARLLEVDKVGVGLGLVGAGRGGGLVRVVQGGEAAEAGLDVAVGSVWRDAEVGVVGAGPAKVVVGLTDGVEEIEGDD